MVAGLGVGFLAGPLVAAAAAGTDNGDSGGGGGGARTTTQLPESASVSRATGRLRCVYRIYSAIMRASSM